MKNLKQFDPKNVCPGGWMRRQLEIQASGLNGNLDKMWRDVRDSAWIGGDAESWERVPYWLDGFIPLAYLLRDEDMIARAEKYVDAILSRQCEDGWICPCAEAERAEYDIWALWILGKALTVYYRCSGDERIPTALYRAMRNAYDLICDGKIKLFDWGKFRWFESCIALELLREKFAEPWIIEFAKLLKAQGANYDDHIEKWKRPLFEWTYETHVVNLAMMLKAEAVYSRLTGEKYTDSAERLRGILREYNGTAVEIFSGDECLAGTSPIRGTELCAVVELMYSYELLYECTGDKKWAERLEVVAFNALPGTLSDDMWRHQYDQQSNQINCVKFPGKSLFGTNNSEAHLFGLEPNYGCCTANFGQGWPKLALSAFMHEGNNVVSVVPIPCKVQTDDFTVELKTEYPFGHTFEYDVSAAKNITLSVRIPEFARGVTVNGKSVSVPATDMLTFEIKAGAQQKIVIAYSVEPEFTARPDGMYSLKCGSIVLALPIAYDKIMREYEKDGVKRVYPYCDYELKGKSEWRYAFGGKLPQVQYRTAGEIPFDSQNPPITAVTEMRRIEWDYEYGYDSVCAHLPKLPIVAGKTEKVMLVPYGCAKLRMTEMPIYSAEIGKKL